MDIRLSVVSSLHKITCFSNRLLLILCPQRTAFQMAFCVKTTMCLRSFVPEQAGETDNDDHIKFHTYESVTSCRSHPEQQLPLRSKSCPKCDELIETYEQRFGDGPNCKIPKQAKSWKDFYKKVSHV